MMFGNCNYFSVVAVTGLLVSCALPLETEVNPDTLEETNVKSAPNVGFGYVCMGNQCRLSDSVQALFSERVGFGREATGGLGGTHCVVRNLADSGDGTLRQCAGVPGPVWITFNRSGTIQLQDNIKLPSNSTVDGRGQEITIKGAGLYVNRVENVIITHLRVREAKDDAINIKYESSRVWINHLSLADSEDGLLDITRGSTNVTVSWCRFDDHRKVMLISGGHENVIDDNIRTTIHHNFFNKTYSRHPRVRRGKVHIYNNLFRKVEGNGITCSHLGQCISEGNIFDMSSDLIRTSGVDPEPGSLKSIDDWSVRGATIQERNPNGVFDARDFYQYEADDADQDLMDRIKNEAGWRSEPHVCADNYEFCNEGAPQQAEGQCAPIPAGHFFVGTTGYYSNGSAFCGFSSLQDWIKSGGPNNTEDAPRYASLPDCMDNHGVCNVEEPQQAEGQCAPIPEGHFFVGNNGYFSNGQAFCGFSSLQEWLDSGGPENTDDAPRYGVLPNCMDNHGVCNEAQPQQADGQCAPIPAGHFFVENTGYYSNGQAFCGFSSLQDWLASGGPSNTDAAPRYDTLPSCMDNHGVCNVDPPQQSQSQCTPIPVGHFFVGNTGYYSNGQAFCGFSSMQAWLASGGPNHTDDAPRYDALPNCMDNHGVCNVN